MKKLFAIVLTVLMLMSIAVGCSSPAETSEDTKEGTAQDAETGETGNESSEAANNSEVRTVAEREDAPDGISLTPSSYTEAQIPGVENVGAKPLKKYKVAFCNGDMANDWRAAFYNDMIACLDYLKEEFGIEYITANSGADSAKQLQDINALLAQQPDILIFSPNESTPLAPVADTCNELGIPFITVDRAIDAIVGEGMYICDIEGDNIRNGVAMGISIVQSLTEKNGEPKGKIAEISGTAGSSPGIQRSAGIRMVLKDYPDIQIVQVLAGDFDAGKAYENAQDILTTNPDLDGIVCSFDSGTMRAMDAAATQGRDDLLYWSADGDTTFLRDYILTGEAECCIEYPPYYGVTALEYAIQYLNGNDIPDTVLLAQRFYMIDTDAKKEALTELSAMCAEAGDPFVPASYGMYDVFTMEGEMWDKYYPQNWVQAGGADYLETLIPEDPFSLINTQ